MSVTPLPLFLGGVVEPGPSSPKDEKALEPLGAREEE
jgi:hypothetical protein